MANIGLVPRSLLVERRPRSRFMSNNYHPRCRIARSSRVHLPRETQSFCIATTDYCSFEEYVPDEKSAHVVPSGNQPTAVRKPHPQYRTVAVQGYRPQNALSKFWYFLTMGFMMICHSTSYIDKMPYTRSEHLRYFILMVQRCYKVIKLKTTAIKETVITYLAYEAGPGLDLTLGIYVCVCFFLSILKAIL